MIDDECRRNADFLCRRAGTRSPCCAGARRGANLADAKKVLIKLELPAREANDLIRAALAAGPCATTEDLVSKALRLRPVSA